MSFLHNLLIVSTIVYSQGTLLLWDLVRDKIPFYTNILNIKPIVWTIAPIYFLFQTSLYLLFEGKKYQGPVTPEGNQPTYKDNGLICWLVTLSLTYFGFSYLDYPEIFDHIGDFQKTLNVYGIIVVLILFFRSKNSSKEKLNEPKFNNNNLQDFYKGVELHPTFTKHELPFKLLVNSRFGMTIWGVICMISLLSRPDKINVFICNLLQLLYITKFFIWEKGYTYSMDITQDRTGYYLIWGCICYVPSVYTLPTIYHHYHTVKTMYNFYLYALVFGIFSIYLNWKFDNQRCEYRKMIEEKKNGYEKLNYITAIYKTSDEKFRTSYLIYSSFYGMAFHMNYLFEILSTFFWTSPGIFPTNIYAYIYLIFDGIFYLLCCI